jgi:hypothetical protein
VPRKGNSKLQRNTASDEVRALNMSAAFGGARLDVKRGKEYLVRKTFDGASIYKCPGCNNSIAAGASSLTVIEQDHIFGEQAAIDERRHWHEGCWKGFR